MGEFFHGWPRKLGVVTLAMALMFMGLWVRGFSVRDEITIGRNKTLGLPARIAIAFGNGWFVGTRHNKHFHQLIFSRGITWRRLEAVDPDWDIEYKTGWRVVPVSSGDIFSVDAVNPYFQTHLIKWRWQSSGFDFGEAQADDVPFMRLSFLTIPNWSITVLMTAVSILFLRTPRKSNPTKSNEPDAVEGT